MSLVIASTTDTQEQVNAAAGVTTPPVPPSEAPPETTQDGEPESATESEPAEDTPDQDTDEESPQKPKHPNVQRRIDRLVREKYQAIGRVQELERQLASSRPPQQSGPPPAPPQVQQGEPQEAQFERYEDFIKAQTRWAVAQEIAEYQRQMRQQAEAQRQQAQHSEWQSRVQAYKAQAPDFESVLSDAEDIQLSPALQQAILEHETGPRLIHELAKDRSTLERIAKLPPASAIRELGKFEAKLEHSLNGEHRNSAVSKAPPPITPVGTGSTKSTKSPDEMDYQTYKRWREKNGARF